MVDETREAIEKMYDDKIREVEQKIDFAEKEGKKAREWISQDIESGMPVSVNLMASQAEHYESGARRAREALERLKEERERKLQEYDLLEKRQTTLAQFRKRRLRCQYCHHVWKPLVKHPERCPKCNKKLKW